MILDVIQVSKDLFSASFTIERENTQIGRHFYPDLIYGGGGTSRQKALKGEGCKIMKRNLFLCLMILMVMCCVGCASVKISEDDTTQDVTEDSSKDDDILAFLKTNNVINSDDTYMGVDQAYRNIRKRG